MLRYLLLVGCVLPAGWSLLPDVAHQPMVHNPFVQLSKVAVAPFFNLSNDAAFTKAISSYHYFLDVARMEGWRGYLQRSEDFVRFCCHMHIGETLAARGGAGQTRVVWRWPSIR